MNIEMDALDKLAAAAFEGFVVRKDLVRRFKGQYPVPTYVAEFLLGRYCASVDEQEIEEGLQIVERQLGEKTVRAGEQELFKARAKELGQIKIIDIITARLDAETDSFVAKLPSLRLNDVRITPEMVQANERMLTGGFYAEIELAYDPTIAQEKQRAALRGRIPAGDPALQARRAGHAVPWPGDVQPRGVEAVPAAQHRPGARADERPGVRRPAPAHGAVRRAQLQHGRARAARHRARATSSSRSRPTRTWSPAARRRSPRCSSTTPTGSAAWSASTTWSASTRFPASPSTRRTASTS